MGSNDPFKLVKLDERSSEYKNVLKNFTDDTGKSAEKIYNVRTFTPTILKSILVITVFLVCLLLCTVVYYRILDEHPC